MNTTLPGIGHNRPPEPLTPERVQATLLETHADLTRRRDELALAQARLPREIKTEEEAGRLSDHIKSLGTLYRAADAARLAAKAPFVALGDAVDGFFRAIMDPADRARKKALALQKPYLDEKAAQAAREAAAEAERLRAEAARKAAEAERADEERRKAEAERDRVRREEEAAFARALEAERRAAEAAAEAKRRAEDEAAAEAARKAKAEADAALAAARAKSREEAAASATAAAAERQSDVAERQLDRAASMERQATKIERDVESGRPADFARTRGAYGSVSTLQRQWFVEIVSRPDLDLLALRPYLPLEALEQAARAFVAAGGRELRGARIYEDTVAQTR